MSEALKFQKEYYQKKIEGLRPVDKFMFNVMVMWVHQRPKMLMVSRIYLAFLISIPIVIYFFWLKSSEINFLSFIDYRTLFFFLSAALLFWYWMNAKFLKLFTAHNEIPLVIVPDEEINALIQEEKSKRNLLIFSSIIFVSFMSNGRLSDLPILGGILEDIGETGSWIGLGTIVFYFLHKLLLAISLQARLVGGLRSSLPNYLEPTTSHHNLRGFWEYLVPFSLAAFALASVVTKIVY